MSEIVSLSVRQLVEFLLSSGDINQNIPSFSSNRLLEGSKIHRIIQKKRVKETSSYTPEVSLSMDIERNGFLWQISGRADGVLSLPDSMEVEELKSTSLPIEEWEEGGEPLHWAQAKCYAYFALQDSPLLEATIRLTYIQAQTLEERSFFSTFSKKELSAFVENLLDRYLPWAQLRQSLTLQTESALSNLTFPFPSYRKGQRELIACVFHAIRDRYSLFAQAPTGIGKTLSTLFPALKAMGEGMANSLFYLTAKESTRSIAEQALLLLFPTASSAIPVLTLSAKSKICFLKEPTCDPALCPYAAGHYDRIRDALYDLLTHNHWLNRETLRNCAQTHTVCPAALAHCAGEWASVVIGDYNHAFDPKAKLTRFLESEGNGNAIFLVDEAHNLAFRGREMFSASLEEHAFLKSEAYWKEKFHPLSDALMKIGQFFLEEKRQLFSSKSKVEEQFPDALLPLLSSFLGAFEQWQKQNSYQLTDKETLSLYFDTLDFLAVAENDDTHYRTVWERKGKDLSLTLFCLDPSPFLKKAYCPARSVIFFSASLLPFSYYRSILGGEKGDKQVALPSPFPPENLCPILVPYISTRYSGREKSYQPIAGLLHQIVTQKPGHYMAYFPSYLYLNAVAEEIAQMFPEIPILVQSPSFSLLEQRHFLKQFSKSDKKSLLGFSVLGGSFSEGIDLTGDSLIGSVVISVGFPQVNVIQQTIEAYYNSKNENGFAYAYTYPGFNKILQAAGRVIRTEKDRGIILLIDDRYLTQTYFSLYPKHWSHLQIAYSPQELHDILSQFYLAD